MWTFIVIAAILIVLILIVLSMLRQRTANVVKNTRVLVCSLGNDPTITQQTNEDCEVYKHHYVLVEKHTDLLTTQLLTLLTEGGYKTVHLLAKYDQLGNILDRDSGPLTPGELFKAGNQGKIKLLYLAGDGSPKTDIAKLLLDAYEASLRGFMVVFTKNRGPYFARFLNNLVARLATGVGLILAWGLLRPQDFGGQKPIEDDGMIAICFGKL